MQSPQLLPSVNAPKWFDLHSLTTTIWAPSRPNWPPIPQRKVYWRADIPRQVTIVRSRCGLVSCYPAHRNCSSRQLALIGEYQQARQECEDRKGRTTRWNVFPTYWIWEISICFSSSSKFEVIWDQTTSDLLAYNLQLPYKGNLRLFKQVILGDICLLNLEI